MSDQPEPTETARPVERYEIRVQGRLSSRWSAWLEGMDLQAEPDGTTSISGPVADQAALHGLLHKLRDVGVPIVSLTVLPPTQPTEPTARTTKEY